MDLESKFWVNDYFGKSFAKAWIYFYNGACLLHPLDCFFVIEGIQFHQVIGTKGCRAAHSSFTMHKHIFIILSIQMNKIVELVKMRFNFLFRVVI